MNKQIKQTIILIIILAVIAGAYFLISSLSDRETPAAVTEEAEKFNDLNKDDIIYISFDGDDERLTFTRTDSTAKWVLEGFEDRDVTDLYINGAISTCCGFEIRQKLENITNYEDFGFSAPAKVVTVKTAGETHTITFGCFNQAESVYYVMIDNDPTVYVYSHAETLPYNNAADYFLEDVEETASDETADAASEETEGTAQNGETEITTE